MTWLSNFLRATHIPHILLFLISILSFYTPAQCVPPLDRYGGEYDVYPDSTTGVRYKFWTEPLINDFEYRSMMDNLFVVWGASNSISECDRWRMVNILLEKRIDPYITYPVGVFRSTVPFDELSVVYYSTGEAVSLNFIDSLTVDTQVAFSTIPVCNEGESLKFK